MHDFNNMHERVKVFFKPLSANPIKCSNTLKTIQRFLTTSCLNVFDHFVGLALKRLKKSSRNIHLEFSVELQLTVKTNQKLTRINSKMFLSAVKTTFLSVTDRLLHKPKLTNVMFKVINKKTLLKSLWCFQN